MRKTIAFLLVAIMVVGMIPNAVSAEGTNDKLLTNNIITINDTNNVGKSTENFKNVESATRTRLENAQVTESEFSADELTQMGRGELVEATRDTLNTGYTPFEETLFGQTVDKSDFKDPAESNDPMIQSIVANKEKSEREHKAAVEYGQKLHESGKTSSDTKYNIVDEVILISTAEELAGLHNQSGYFRLVNDIILTSTWTPIDFYGVLEGAGYTITGAEMMAFSEYDYVGFFSVLGPDAVVSNLNLVYPSVYGNANVGAFCGHNQGIISNCHVVNGCVLSYMWTSYEYPFWTMSGYNVGGMVGLNEGYVMDCSFTGDIDGWSSMGGIAGTNTGYVFACASSCNVGYELNTYDFDITGAEYYAAYGYEYYPPLTTMLRFQWSAMMMIEYGYTVFGLNGGLVGVNGGYVLDCFSIGYGSGTNYGISVIAGFDCVGGLIGADCGYTAHSFSIDKAFPVANDGAEIYYPWEYGEAGYGIYYQWDYFLIHQGIGYNCEAVTTEADEVFYFEGAASLPCEDGLYHGTPLSSEQFYTASTFSNWNHGEWNNGDVWAIVDGTIPSITECPVIPNEWVIAYVVGTPGATFANGETVVYKLAKYDEQTGTYIQPMPPTSSASGSQGIVSWSPAVPFYGNSTIYQDTVFTAYFGNVGSKLLGDVTLDKKVNSGDAVKLLRGISFAELDTFTYQQMVNAEVTFDGKLNTGDAVQILRYVAGIIPSFGSPRD